MAIEGSKLPSIVEDWLEEDSLELLECWARDGYTYYEIAERMGVSEIWLRKWRDEYPEIKAALKRGREMVDYKVENALLKSALGYKTKEVKVITLMRFGKVIETSTEVLEKDQAPSVPAIQMWLYNRCPDKWMKDRDRSLDLSEDDARVQVIVTRAGAVKGNQPLDDSGDEVNESVEVTSLSEEEQKQRELNKKNEKNQESADVSDLDQWPDDWEEDE